MAAQKRRNNHYVPQWYQEGFFQPGRNDYSYLDLSPPQHTLADGRVVTEKSKFTSPTSRAFSQRDLYSTFFGTSVNDEIETKLFGNIDTRGADAVRAFIGEDVREWHDHFATFFEYIDIQKIRTPKGLDWLKAQYPRLTQNELMLEMQGVQKMHCTIWTEGVREIVSAQDSEVKFIVSDHPVTVYNYTVPPDAKANNYPGEPSIALKGSQTIFPLSRDFCLILTNLEYAKDNLAAPLEKRTFAGNYRNSMVRTDAFIRSRKLTSAEVIRVNRIVKTRAKRYIAGGREEWLYPEASSAEPWADLGQILLPPRDDLWRFGGEIYAKFENGDVHYQDAFGRTEKEREFLKKPLPEKRLRARDFCGCGSGRRFEACCQPKPVALRPTWEELSIRERNLGLYNAIAKILGLTEDRDWVTVRREITDEKIRDVYSVYDALWPLQTNLLAMLPKPDGTARAIYTGLLHPSTISNCAPALPLYFDEVLVQDPFIHPRTVNKEFSPLEHPHSFRQEFLSSALLFLTLMPFVEQGRVTLFPDPCNFDFHLRGQMFQMSRARLAGVKIDRRTEAGFMKIEEEELRRVPLLMSREDLRRYIQRLSPELNQEQVEAVLHLFDRRREEDPLCTLQEGALAGGPNGGQLTPFKMQPNFEIAMYLAQATGSCIVTDSAFRWRELKATVGRDILKAAPLSHLRAGIEQAGFIVPHDLQDIGILADRGLFAGYPGLMRKVFRYLSKVSANGPKPNVEANLLADFKRVHAASTSAAKRPPNARVLGLWPADGIQDNSVNRLLLMSSSEHHLPSTPMALFIKVD